MFVEDFSADLDFEDVVCMDGGYFEIPTVSCLIPHRKPRDRNLTFEEEYENRIISEFRGDIERKFGILVSKFSSCNSRWRYPEEKFNSTFRVCLSLLNAESLGKDPTKFNPECLNHIFFSQNLFSTTEHTQATVKQFSSVNLYGDQFELSDEDIDLIRIDGSEFSSNLTSNTTISNNTPQPSVIENQSSLSSDPPPKITEIPNNNSGRSLNKNTTQEKTSIESTNPKKSSLNSSTNNQSQENSISDSESNEESPLKLKTKKSPSLCRAFAEISNKPLNKRTRGKKQDYYSMEHPKDLNSPSPQPTQKKRMKSRKNTKKPRYSDKKNKRKRSY